MEALILEEARFRPSRRFRCFGGSDLLGQVIIWRFGGSDVLALQAFGLLNRSFTFTFTISPHFIH